MNTKTLISLLLVIIAGATIANLIALKIASDQVSAKLKTSGGTTGSILNLLGGA
jgi:hypothetical protein